MSKLTSYEKAWLRWVSSALDHNRLTGLDRELAMNSQGVVFGPPSGKKTSTCRYSAKPKCSRCASSLWPTSFALPIQTRCLQ